MNKQTSTGTMTGLEIAVVGAAGRFPGAHDIHRFWNNLKEGVESIASFTGQQLHDAGVEPELYNNPDYVKVNGMLQDADSFDASFFNYIPREAEIMNPQTRLLLECAWHALENAGYNPDVYDGMIGFYAGASSSVHWEAMSFLSGQSEEVGQFAANHFAGKDFSSTLISYKLNLKGPSVVVQSACSTSLVAIHWAARAVLSGECDMALAGGVSIDGKQENGYLYQEGMILSPDGHNRAFDARANGTVGGNGVGLVVLKRYKKALADGDTIYALIKGSAINNDGNRKVGFSAPSVKGQAEVIRTALAMSRVEPRSISYIETHGTATNLGDPVEIEALKRAFNTGTEKHCGLGSVKSNIGHLSAAAGVAGFIKTMLALRHKVIPPSLHFESPNPKFNLEESPFYVNTGLAQWQQNGHPRRAGVSSFGIGGTNAHVVLEEAPEPLRETVSEQKEKYRLMTLSARTAAVLEKHTANLGRHLKENPGINLADAAYTLHVGRKDFEHRRTVVTASSGEAAELLTTLSADAVSTSVASDDPPPVVFMFSGQGSQYVDMARGLYDEEPFFRQQVDRCTDILEKETGFDVKGILYPSLSTSCTADEAAEKINHVFYSGPVKFTIEYALAKLLMFWGIKPYAMIGHSFGEFVAAHLAGVFSLEDALRLVVLRGRLMEQTPDGAMTSVPMAEEELREILPDDISLAAVNTDSLCIVSGLTQAVERFEEELGKDGCECLRLNFPRASHSASMGSIFEEFKQHVAGAALNKPEIPYIAGLTGNWVTASEATDPAYWARHFMETVRFSDGIRTLAEKPGCIFIQVGCDRGLPLFVKQLREQQEENAIVNMVRHPKEEVSDSCFFLDRVGHLWTHGVTVDWSRLYTEENRKRIPLPTYPFQQQRYRYEWNSLEQGEYMMSGQGTLRKKEDISQWFYTPSWERWPWLKTGEEETAATFSSPLLVFNDKRGLGRKVLEKLKRENVDVVTVDTGESFDKTGDSAFTIDPGQEDHYDRLFRELKEMDRVPGNILHLWGVAEETGDTSLDSGFYSLLYIARASVRQSVTTGIKIIALTGQMQEVMGEEVLSPVKSTVLGAVKVIPREYPNIDCRSIDITSSHMDDPIPEGLVDRLTAEFSAPYDQREVAYRGHHRWVRVYTPTPIPSPKQEELPLRQDGVYLVTGGLGGIGAALAAHLAQTVNARLILVGRTREQDLDETKKTTLRELEDLASEILLISADVSDGGQMRSLIEGVRKRFGTINGVIHSAGLPDGGVIQLRTRQSIDNILESKVAGTLILEEALQDEPLDFLVLCSSLASVFEPAGQVGYCAANAFLDAFAQYKSRKDGTLAVSINWDTWREAGMAIEAVKHLDEKRAMEVMKGAMTSAEGVEAFRRILHFGQPRTVVSTRDLCEAMTLQRRAKEEEKTAAATGQEEAGQSPEIALDRTRLNTDYTAPGTELEKQLTTVWENYFGTREIGVDDDFFQLGGDSLKALSLSTLIHKTFEVKVPVSEFFSRPTIREMALFIQSGARKNTFTAIEPVGEKDHYTLSSAQKRLYVLYRMDPGSVSYNITNMRILWEGFDLARMEETFKKLLARHQSFRTSFETIDGQALQKIHDHVDFEIEYYNENYEYADGQERQNLIRQFVRPFDLSQAPLLRVGVIKDENQHHTLMLDMHHIIADGVSYHILIEDFMTLYQGNDLPPLTLHYKDYAHWQSQRNDSPEIKKQEDFWLNEFKKDIPALHLPLDYPRPVVKSYEGSKMTFMLDPRETDALNHIARQEGVTMFMLMMSIYNIFLCKLSGQENIVVGSPVAGRKHAGLERIIGMFVNTVAIDNTLSSRQRFVDFLKQVKEKTLAVFENQDYPFEDLVEKLGVARDTSRNPIFDTMFVFQNIDRGKPDITLEQEAPEARPADDPGVQPGVKPDVRQEEYEYTTSKFDLTLEGTESGDGMFLLFEYCTKLFKKETIERFICYLKNIVSSIIEDPTRQLWQIEIMPEAEIKQVLYDFNDTAMPFPVEQTIIPMVEEQAARNPGNIAVTSEVQGASGKPETRSLTYGQLNERANRLARHLLAKGVKPDMPVALTLERSPGMIIAMLGIMKAGGAYLPIDIDYPKERIAFMLRDSDVRFLVTTGDYEDCCPGIEMVDPGIAASPEIETANPGIISGPANLAYIIYTSGTTGRPKGVLIRHRNLTLLIYAHREIFAEDQGDCFSQVASPGFDAMVAEVWPALACGASLAIAHNEIRLDPVTMKKWLIRNRVSISFQPTVIAEQLLNLEWPEQDVTLRVLKSAGDTLTRYPTHTYPFELFNLYGPTEDTVWTTSASIKGDTGNGRLPTIGRPIANHRVYILSDDLTPRPVGVRGELCIAGEGLAAGYLNRPTLTKEKFVDNPFPEVKRIYKTGDIARWLPEGDIEFIGRNDNQVKIRGIRIEQGEIEHCLQRLEAVSEACVTVHYNKTGDGRLVAYVVPGREFTGDNAGEKEQEALVKRFRDSLKEKLPAYMVPSIFVLLDALPLTANGKVDRDALPEPGTASITEEYVAPANPLEEKMVEIWAQVLGMEKENISCKADLFQLGGHSLNAVALASRIEMEMQVKIPLTELFKYPTITELTGLIENAPESEYAAILPSEEKEYYPLSSAQKRMYFMSIVSPDSTTYNLPLVLELEGRIDVNRLEKAFAGLIKRHQNLRTTFEMKDGEVVQRIREDADFTIDYHVTGDRRESDRLIIESVKPFDMSRAPLLKVCLFKESEEKHLMLVDMPHIITDGVSQSILARDFSAYYDGKSLPPLELHYRDFTRWQNRLLKSEAIQKEAQYWQDRFKGDIPVLNLATDYPRPEDGGADEGDFVDVTIDGRLASRLYEFTKQTGTTPFMVLLAVYNILLARYAGQEDIVVGAPVTGRPHNDLQNIIGMFVNMLALRNRPQAGKSFSRFLEDVKKNALDAFENQNYQFDELTNQLGLQGGDSGSPLFRVVLNMLNMDAGQTESDDGPVLKTAPYKLRDIIKVPFDLILTVGEIGAENGSENSFENSRALAVTALYSATLFKREKIEKMMKHFVDILEKVLDNPDIFLEDISISHSFISLQPEIPLEEDGDFSF